MRNRNRRFIWRMRTAENIGSGMRSVSLCSVLKKQSGTLTYALRRRKGASLPQFGNHFGELTTCAIGCIGQAKILEDLEEPLLLVEESDMFPGTIDLSKQTPADNCQSPIA